jgi:hypothetical protein
MPGVPHGWQTLFAQMAFPALHVPPLQQGEPRSPHLAQMPALHEVPDAVQTPVPQQGSPAPPQVPQAPAAQMPPPRPTHTPPADMQMPDTQQPPPAQPLPSQHCRPGWPQAGTVLPPLPSTLPSSPPNTTPVFTLPPPPWAGGMTPPVLPGTPPLPVMPPPSAAMTPPVPVPALP